MPGKLQEEEAKFAARQRVSQNTKKPLPLIFTPKRCRKGCVLYFEAQFLWKEELKFK